MAHTDLEVAPGTASVSSESSAVLSWWSHAWPGIHVQMASSLRLRCCWACAQTESAAPLCTLTVSCNPQWSSCSQRKNGTGCVPLRPCCRQHKSHLLTLLTWPSWVLNLCHPLRQVSSCSPWWGKTGWSQRSTRECYLIEVQHLPSFYSLGLGFEVYFASPGPLRVVRAGMGIPFCGMVPLRPRISQWEGIIHLVASSFSTDESKRAKIGFQKVSLEVQQSICLDQSHA